MKHGIKGRHEQKGQLWATMNSAVQLLPSLTFRSCLLFSFQGDTFHLLKGLIETNTSNLMRLFRALIRPANWLFPNHIIYFCSISRLSGLNTSACMSWMNFLGTTYIRVSMCLPKDGKFKKWVECWHVSVTAWYWLLTVLPALLGCGEHRRQTCPFWLGEEDNAVWWGCIL